MVSKFRVGNAVVFGLLCLQTAVWTAVSVATLLAPGRELTFPQLRDIVRPNRLWRNPCPGACSYVEFFDAHDRVNLADLVALMNDFRDFYCISLVKAGYCTNTTALPSNDPFHGFINNNQLDTLLRLQTALKQKPQLLQSVSDIRDNRPQSTHAAISIRQGAIEPSESGLLIGCPSRNGIGNRAWVWGSVFMMSITLDRPMALACHERLLGIPSLLTQGTMLPWMADTRKAKANSTHFDGDSAQLLSRNKAEDLFFAADRPQSYVSLTRKVLREVADRTPEERLRLLLGKFRTDELKKHYTSNAVGHGITMFTNILLRPTRKLTKRLIEDVKTVLGNQRDCYLFGVHIRVGVGAEKVQDFGDLDKHAKVVMSGLRALRHPKTKKVPKPAVVFVASDSKSAADAFCASLSVKIRCFHFLQDDIAGSQHGHWLRPESKEEAQLLSEENKENIAYEILRDIFILSISDILGISDSTFSLLAMRWGRLPVPAVKVRPRFASAA